MGMGTKVGMQALKFIMQQTKTHSKETNHSGPNPKKPKPTRALREGRPSWA